MDKTLVIAEPGCTAEGNLHRMMRLIDVAAACGANVYKSTWIFDLPQMMTRRNRSLDSEDYDYWRKVYGWHVWPVEWHDILSFKCHSLGMQYACTVHTPNAVEPVAPAVDMFKISSFEGDYDLRVATSRTGKKTIVSTGMGRDDSVFYRLAGQERILQCTSCYPAPPKSLNIAVLRGEVAPCGLSDHSRDVITGAVAVGAGARIIEAHYRLDDCDPSNPDYATAFSPAEFAEYIRNIRKAEVMMGDGVKRIEPCEEPMLKYRVRPKGVEDAR